MSEDNKEPVGAISDLLTLYFLPSCESEPRLDSFSPECLATGAYLRFVGVLNHPKVLISHSTASKMSPSGDFPFLTLHDEVVASNSLQIIEYFARMGYWLDHSFSPQQLQKITLLRTLIRNSLPAVWTALSFQDDDNYNNVSSGVIVGNAPFPLNRILRSTRRNTYLQRAAPITIPEALSRAEEIFQILENELPDRATYFLGDKPSSLDAYVYGFLACLYYSNLGKIRKLISHQHPTLATYLRGIAVQFQQPIKFEVSQQTVKPKGQSNFQEESEGAKDKKGENSEEHSAYSNKIFLAVCASFLVGSAIIKYFNGK